MVMKNFNMAQSPEGSLFKEALGAQEKIEDAKAQVARAREELTTANYKYGRASAELVRILQEAKDENTAELQTQAEKEHYQILRDELNAATKNEDYEQVAILAKKILEIRGKLAPIGGAQEVGVRDELSQVVEEFIDANRITSEEDKLHYRQRAKLLASKDTDATPDDIVSALQRERDKATPPKTAPGWVGHHR